MLLVEDSHEAILPYKKIPDNYRVFKVMTAIYCV